MLVTLKARLQPNRVGGGELQKDQLNGKKHFFLLLWQRFCKLFCMLLVCLGEGLLSTKAGFGSAPAVQQAAHRVGDCSQPRVAIS